MSKTLQVMVGNNEQMLSFKADTKAWYSMNNARENEKLYKKKVDIIV